MAIFTPAEIERRWGAVRAALGCAECAVVPSFYGERPDPQHRPPHRWTDRIWQPPAPPGKLAMGFSETVRVTDQGCELITQFERRLFAA